MISFSFILGVCNYVVLWFILLMIRLELFCFRSMIVIYLQLEV